MIGYKFSASWWRDQAAMEKVMLSYKTTQAQRDAANAEADRLMKQHAAAPYSHVRAEAAAEARDAGPTLAARGEAFEKALAARQRG